MVIAAGGTVLTDWRDWPVAAFFVVIGGLFAAGGVHLLRRAGKPRTRVGPDRPHVSPAGRHLLENEAHPMGTRQNRPVGGPDEPGEEIRVLRLRTGAGQELGHASVRFRAS
jgi:hypothetical protein